MSTQKKEIQTILWSHLSYVQQATQKEKALFPDKKDGWFYTFGLESGQEFIAHFSLPKKLNDEKERKVVGEITFRPTNNVLPDLREIQFLTPTRLEHKTILKLTSNVDPQEKRKYSLKRVDGFFENYAPFIQKALDVHELLLSLEISKEDMSFYQSSLQEELFPRKKVIARHLKKQNINVVRHVSGRIKD